jgi:hypothetical protein
VTKSLTALSEKSGSSARAKLYFEPLFNTFSGASNVYLTFTLFIAEANARRGAA